MICNPPIDESGLPVAEAEVVSAVLLAVSTDLSYYGSGCGSVGEAFCCIVVSVACIIIISRVRRQMQVFAR